MKTLPNPARCGLLALTALFIATLLPARAGDTDLSFAFEGDAEKRARLAQLQGNTSPPALKVDGWLNSEALKLADLKGKIVVLDFWATWCGPCISSIPHTNDMMEKYGDKVVIIGVCAARGAEKMADVVKEHGIKYPVVIDTEGQSNDAYEVNGYPDYFIIDAKGVLRVADCANSQVEKAVDALLDEQDS